MSITTGLKEAIVDKLCTMLHQCNHYVQLLKTVHEFLEQSDNVHECQVMINEDQRPLGEHARQFNASISNDIGMLMPNQPINNRDIVLRHRDEKQVQQVSELHRAYDAHQYPLLFSHGTDGYSIYLRQCNGKKVTQMAYVVYAHVILVYAYVIVFSRDWCACAVAE